MCAKLYDSTASGLCEGQSGQPSLDGGPFFEPWKGSVKVEKHNMAEADYMAGMKYREIAEKYGTTINTVKSWKKRYGWERKSGAPKEKKTEALQDEGTQSEPVPMGFWDDGTKETLRNEKLSDKQQLFCIYYSRTFNVALSYHKAYGCAYNSAKHNGYRMFENPEVRKEIERLKEIKRQQILASEEDIVELQMRIAFSDIADVLEFNKNRIRMWDSAEVDTQLIAEVKEGRYGLTVKLEDRQKAIDWLSKYFLMHPDDRYKAEFDKKRAEVRDDSAERILENMQTLADIIAHPAANRTIEDFEEGVTCQE